MNRSFSVFLCVVLLQLQGFADSVLLDELQVENCTQGWGEPKAGRSVENNPLNVGGVVYKQGVGTHAPSLMIVDLKSSVSRFTAFVGVDNEVGNGRGSVRFVVKAEGKELYKSKVLRCRLG